MTADVFAKLVLMGTTTAHKAAALVCMIVALTVEAHAGNAALIDLPWIAQKSSTECGRAVLASLGARYRQDVERAYQHLKEVKPGHLGYNMDELEAEGQKLGLHLKDTPPTQSNPKALCSINPRTEQYFNNLANHISSGRPVVIVISLASGAAHYVILTGFQSDYFIVHDPLSPDRTFINRADLAIAMCRSGYRAWVVYYLPQSRRPLAAK